MTKVKTLRRCKSEGCTFTTTSIKRLQNHFEREHSLTERVKHNLVISGNEYLALSGVIQKNE